MRYIGSSGVFWVILLMVSAAQGFDCTLQFREKEFAKLSARLTETEIGQWAAVSIKRQHGVAASEEIVKRVGAIVDRLRQVVRKRPEILYTVEVFDTLEKGACAYPGGYVFLTRGLLELATDDNELAMVIAHEFAHIAAGQTDRPIEDELPARLEKRFVEIGAVGRGFSVELRDRVCRNVTADEIRKIHELRADEEAIVYIALAGYNPAAVYTILDKVGARVASSCQPSRQERKVRIARQVQGIIDQLEKFQAGVRFYVQQEYEHAAEAFTTFLSVYPGREVHHNLATTYHRLALSYQEPASQLKVKCSMALEAETQAVRLHRRSISMQGRQEKFQHYLTEAIEQYTHALRQDPAYAPAAVNLACAYLEQGKSARAQGELEDANRPAQSMPWRIIT